MRNDATNAVYYRYSSKENHFLVHFLFFYFRLESCAPIETRLYGFGGFVIRRKRLGKGFGLNRLLMMDVRVFRIHHGVQIVVCIVSSR